MVTKALSTDSIQSTADGLDFGADNETYVIEPEIVVLSETSYGVSSNGQVNCTLVNEGFVYGNSNAFGVGLFGSSDARVINEASGQIFSPVVGVLLDATVRDEVDNFGKIVSPSATGLAGVGVNFFTSAGTALLDNHGYVVGSDYGVTNSSHHSGGTIHNFGTIRSNNIGIGIDAGSLTTVIHNAAAGVIKGVSQAIHMYGGKLHLLNDGTIVGDIVDSDNLNHVVVNRGHIKGVVKLGSGKDYFNGAGGTSRDIHAGGGNDRIIVDKGNVSIFLGGGNDTVTGGPGADKLVFNAPLALQVDKITNFTTGHDKIVLSVADFAGVGPVGGVLAAADFHVGTHAAAVSQYIIYDPTNGFVFYDPHDGSPQDHFATISPHLALSHSDFLVGA
jgi:Ca2+-binding RTX toxin-like protein